MSRWLVAAALTLIIFPGNAAAQSGDPKSNFVQALGQFSLSLDGAYGDEGPRILASLDALDRSVTQWDDAIRGYEGDVARNLPADPTLAALMHVGLGGLYLDRARFVDAQREFDAAIALDPSRPDTFTLQGLARAAARDYVGAAVSFRTALDLDPGDTARAYVLARTLTLAGKPDDARTVLHIVIGNQQRAAADRVAAVSARFMRFGLVEERSGVEPFFPPAIYADGFARLQRGEFGPAVARLRTAAASDVVVSDAVNQSYAVRKAANAFRGGDLAEAIVQLQAAIELDPDRAEPHRLLGLAYAAGEQYERGIAELRSAIAKRPTDERARLALADVLVRADQATAAAQSLRDAIAAIPRSGRAHYVLARLYQRQGKQAEALQEFDAAVAFAPLLGLNGIYQTMGTLAAARQDFDRALDAYSQRVTIQPNAAGAHQDLGDTYARLGRTDEAFAELAVALTLDPESSAAFAGMAQLYLRNSEYEAAAAAARRAVDIEPAHRQARYALGTALIRLGKTDEGQKELIEFQRLQEQDAAARAKELELGGLRREATVSSGAGDHRKAVALLRKALVLAPDEAVSYLNLGMALVLAEQPADAIEYLRTAAAMNAPIEVHRQLAGAYAALGQTDNSRRELDVYEQLTQARLQRTGADR